MSCPDREPQLSAYMDGELDASARAGVEAHVATCASCAARLEEWRVLSRTIRAGASSPDPDPALLRRLGESLREERPSRRTGIEALATHALAAAAAAVLAWMAASWWTRPSEERRVGEEVVAAHVRSLLADHLTDVTSSDRHAVNPWFQGKIDFAVGARDHADRGFVLEGGRLDYVDGSVVASIVYRHGKHAMNLFVWRSRSAETESVGRFVSRGYRAGHWRAGGLSHWLVSDADESTLEELTEFLRSDE